MARRLWLLYNPILVALAFVWRRVLRRSTLIAITGSTGKTTAKKCLAAILARHAPGRSIDYPVPGRFGHPRLLLGARPRHRFIVAEVGILKTDVMWRSALLLRPDIAVILAVNWQHSDNFRSLEIIASEKAKLLDGLPRDGVAVLNGDDPRVAAMADRGPFRVVTFGLSPKNDVWADQITARWPRRLEFDAHCGDETVHVQTRLVGAHWVVSALAAMAAAKQCGVSLAESARALETVEPFTGRLQPVRLPQGATLLRDENNGSAHTLAASLRILEEASAARRVAVLGTITDAYHSGDELARRIGRQAARVAEMVVFVGAHGRACREAAIAAGLSPSDAHHFPSAKAAAEFLRDRLREGDLVLLKGAYFDHLSRLYFRQLGTVGCWKTHCRRPGLCDRCPELQFQDAKRLETQSH